MKTKLIFLIILVVSVSVFITSCSNQDDIKKEEDNIIDLMGGPDEEEYQNLLKLGNYYFVQGNMKKAKDYYRKAVKAEPNSYEAHFNLALVHDTTFNFVLAKKEYRAAIRIKPESIKAHLNLGLVIYKDDRANYEDALHEFFWVLEKEPDNPNALYNIAVIYTKTDEDKALEFWKRYITAAKDNETQNNNIIKALGYIELLESRKNKGEEK